MHYLLVPYFISFIFIIIFSINLDSSNSKAGLKLTLWTIILSIGYILSFQEQIHGDALRYYNKFLALSEFSFFEMLENKFEIEYGYLIVNWMIGQVNESRPFFFFMLFLIFILIFIKSIKIIYSEKQELNILSLYVLYPYFLFYIANAKRQGLGLVLMLLAIAYIYNNQKRLGYFILALTPLFHTSMIIIIPIVLFYSWAKTETLFKVSKLIFISSLLLAITNLNETLLGYFQFLIESSDKYNGYFGDEFAYINYRTGFRLDFTLFSIFPVILYYYYKKNINKDLLNYVQRWLGLYLLLASVYQFFSFMAFSDRFAVFSWFILPLMCYTIIYNTNNSKHIFYFVVIFFATNLFLIQTYTGSIFGSLGLY